MALVAVAEKQVEMAASVALVALVETAEAVETERMEMAVSS